MPILLPGWLGTQRTVPALRRARDLLFPAHRTPVPLVGIPWDRGSSFHVFLAYEHEADVRPGGRLKRPPAARAIPFGKGMLAQIASPPQGQPP
jgi:hypothetical protein